MPPNGTVDLTALIDPHVRPAPAVLHRDATLGSALAELRARGLPADILYLYVIDDERHLVGVLPTRRALIADLSKTVYELSIRDPVTLRSGMTILEACDHFLHHRYLAFPVVDDQGCLLGTIDARLFTDEIAQLSEGRAADELFQVIGIHVAQGRKASTWRQFSDRFPWLTANIAGGIACAVLAGAFEDVLARALALALFIPVVLALAESVSMQSMTITMQELHHGKVTVGSLSRALLREFSTALLIALACASIVAGIAFVWKAHAGVALTLGLSLLTAMVGACLLGVLLPSLVRASGRDPRIASGPLVLAATDLMTLTAFFMFASRLI